MSELLKKFSKELEGEIHYDTFNRILYATDASMYREMPQAVVYPKNNNDLKKVVKFAQKHNLGIIPRAAGTSLAGQVVGNGIVVEVAKHFTQLLEVNEKERWCRVQPGIIRDDLNLQLKKHGLLFGPETSTANRAMIGGMIGNNSCGLHSIIWGSTRDHLISCKVILSDGSETEFKELTPEEFKQKLTLKNLEGNIYRKIYEELSVADTQEEIQNEFPKPHIPRRNNGYAIDLLLRSNIFTPSGPNFNMCKLIAGSEGTLCLITEAKLRLEPLPPKVIGCVAMHFNDIIESLKANVIAVNYKPGASELIDDYTVKLARTNPTASQNSQWIIGDPKSVIIVEFARNSKEEIEEVANSMVAEIKSAGLGYAFPIFYNDDTKPLWDLRKAVLGLMYSGASDVKPVNLVEDCSVDVIDLPEFYDQHQQLIKAKGVELTTSAHCGTGELHTLPFINLKSEHGIKLLREILEETVVLVKKYNGSLSGEHGDGRLRAEFIRKMVGEKNYELCRQLKYTWDPKNIFNPNKIVDTPPMDVDLRYTPGQETPLLPTYFNWDKQGGVIRATELCNGTAECKKSGATGGIMCPSYMATLNEKDTTRARANVLREFLTHSRKTNRFDQNEIYEVMDLCLSCKGCKSECPSSVDVAKLKAEFLQHYYDANGAPLRSKLIANFTKSMTVASNFPRLFNFFVTNNFTSGIFKKLTGFAPKRSIPTLYKTTLKRWYKHNNQMLNPADQNYKGSVYLFCDEFTNLNDVEIGITTIKLLNRLGYNVLMTDHPESGRTQLSKGFVKQAIPLAKANVEIFSKLINERIPLIAIEPSIVTCFKDDYVDLVGAEWALAAAQLAKNSLMFEEFIADEIEKGKITSDQFTQEKRTVKLHIHCHQKSLSSPIPLIQTLSLPRNYIVMNLPTSCCGMAGSFGYEAEHYEVSQTLGEMVLFPAVRNSSEGTIIAASGTSCRHQIKDGTGVRAKHTAEILYDALI
ncbi:FAD-binding and (Fe-S)-binding domain-containing protein [Solitalea koreensis]|uniref:Fe-S oxidoreductase n=1 Tax=Solitalea koreensis TaxID=543615 RepID=A0A521AG77_9SPHI|nr:FAD-binding and (Fe-S)-binding domain-containing protein [Solitalea koreensis]SMO33748.1 Fe-S oxidoreductase [Solitalea koreensis]